MGLKSHSRVLPRLELIFISLLSLALASCGGGVGSGSVGTMGSPRVLQGRVHGGQQPVYKSVIQLYAVGTDYGDQSDGTATPLIGTTVQTARDGSFSITGDYTCPTPDAEVYIVATGGSPGLGPNTSNTALAMMAALGSCNTLFTNALTTFIYIDEVTTAASVYSLAQFMGTNAGSPGGSMGATGGSTSVGLINAMAMVNNLVDTTTGVAPGLSLPSD